MTARRPDAAPLLRIAKLTISLPARDGTRLHAVRDVDLDVAEGQVVGLAGESGSGKSVTALSLLGLLPASAEISGEIRFEGRDLLTLRAREMRDVRGRDIAMIFQDPMTSLHPMLSVGRQMTEHLRHHRKLGRGAARTRAAEFLDLVRIPNPRAALERFPHQFSGGMRQRIAIASALCCEPRLLVADEPTTALDVTVQAGILRLLDRLRGELALSVLMITHDLGVMSAIADRVAVMYAGRIVERGPRRTVLGSPRHPYTRGLLDALPDPDAVGQGLTPIAGAPPTLSSVPAGCAFHERCPWAEGRCARRVPALERVGPERASACHVDPLAPSAREVSTA